MSLFYLSCNARAMSGDAIRSGFLSTGTISLATCPCIRIATVAKMPGMSTC